MLAYNGPCGPTLKVAQDSTITVKVTNRGDLDATVHRRPAPREPLRRHARPQAPIPVGETFVTRCRCPIWRLLVSPHIREDYGQEMACTGTSSSPRPSPNTVAANRELLLTLDDILIEDGQIAAFSETETTHVAMGRFGNVMLVAGESDLARGQARRGRPLLLHQHSQYARLQRGVAAPR
jgi:hypothetical protein